MLATLGEVFKGRRVFLTGHTGFKGSWMLSWLHLLGAELMGYALAPSCEDDLYVGINGDSLCKSVIADIRDRDLLKKTIVDFQPDFVFHLAAQPLVRSSYFDPIGTFEINIIGTANVLDSVRHLPKKCVVVVITTDKVYENKEWLYPYREIDRLGGYDPYSASKACAELVVSSYLNSFFNATDHSKHQKSISCARAGNVIGGGDWSNDRIIPDIIRALRSKEAVEVRNPISVRPWQHVLEPISAYLMLAARMDNEPQSFSENFNFGPNSEDNLTVEELVKAALQAWGTGSYSVAQLKGELHEATLLRLDISKAKSKLDWFPKTNASKAVKMTIDWYKHFLSNKATIMAFTQKQIIDFING